MAPALALGVSLPPNNAHALSVSMPKWEHVVGYEEGNKEVLDAMACGYPRFFYHPFVVALTQLLKTRAPFAEFFPGAADGVDGDEQAWNLMVSPTLATAQRLQSFLIASAKNDPKIEDVDGDSEVVVTTVQDIVWVVRFPHRLSSTAKQFWQHSGEIVSSRHAEIVLKALKEESSTSNAATAASLLLQVNQTGTHKELHERIASLYLGDSAGASSNVFVYPTGMGAIFASVRLANKIRPGAKSVLFGFPYVDTLKILSRSEWCANGVHFFPVCGEKEMRDVEEILKREPILGVFTEFPGNPLLSTPDLSRLASLAHENGAVLVVDDTVGSYNVNVMQHGAADIVTTSLSKIFSGTCDVMGGSLVLNPAGPLYTTLKQHISSEDAFVVEEDAKVLLQDSVDLLPRLAKVNSSASIIAQRLQAHPLVKSIYYPELQEKKEQFTKFLSNGSSSDGEAQFGPLISIVLKGELPVATAFYDAVNVAKGPSLGTNFTICCPYTLLAHYYELDFVESCGVDRNLIRISIGLEEVEEIWSEIDSALQAATEVFVPESA